MTHTVTHTHIYVPVHTVHTYIHSYVRCRAEQAKQKALRSSDELFNADLKAKKKKL